MAIEITPNSDFKKLNEDPSYRIKAGGVGREKELVVNIAIGDDDDYVTGGITLDFAAAAGINFTQVYLCDVIQGKDGLLAEFIPATRNAAASGKLKFYGSGLSSGVAFTELASESELINSKSLVCVIRGV